MSYKVIRMMKYPNVLLVALLVVLLTNFAKSDIAIYEESTGVQQISVKRELLRFRTEKLTNNTVKALKCYQWIWGNIDCSEDEIWETVDQFCIIWTELVLNDWLTNV